MKLLAALTLLLPAVHVAALPGIDIVALPGNFGLRIGPNSDDPVVVKSPEHPEYYVVDESVRGGTALRFELGDNNILIDQDKKSVIVDDLGDLRVGLDVKLATSGFFFDKDGKLSTLNDVGESFYLCPLSPPGKMKLRLSLYLEPDCQGIDLYKIL
ncbi:hypothetical protein METBISCDRAFT_24268 [Metschnikowia bicuspidata]|uniref:Uncharacterized protein n=1 Tax=Metschnikowia bicuspidata TaxID=27322 RepID=A0A4P9Z9J5_9ASCO|nr:hypothetical protein METBISCDRAFT_24268 [Metschnikowia bicuspidata]